jgi:DNA-binding transcriptional LysR family regulator
VHNKWQFAKGNDKHIVTVNGNKVSDDGDMVRQWAVDGEGVAYKSKLDVLEDVRAGRLVLALEDYTAEPAPLHFITAQRVSAMPAAHALLDYLNDAFKAYLAND